MYLTVDSLIDTNNIITGLDNVDMDMVKCISPYGYGEMYIDKDLIEDKLHQLIDQFNERKISLKDFYTEFLENIHPFYDRNGRTFKTSFYLQLGLWFF